MGILIKILVTFLQITISVTAGVAVYLFFCFMDYREGIDSMIGITIIQPMFGLVLSFLSVILFFLIGLPIRLNKKINTWWLNRMYIPVSLLSVSFILLLLSLIFTSPTIILENDTEILRNVPNIYMACMGWCLMIFSILHIFPLGKRIEKYYK